MACNNAMDTALHIALELCSNGVLKKFIYLFLFSSCLTLHLALQSLRVFKASSAFPVSLRKKERELFSPLVL
jgi:hypothetical protein